MSLQHAQLFPHALCHEGGQMLETWRPEPSIPTPDFFKHHVQPPPAAWPCQAMVRRGKHGGQQLSHACPRAAAFHRRAIGVKASVSECAATIGVPKPVCKIHSPPSHLELCLFSTLTAKYFEGILPTDAEHLNLACTCYSPELRDSSSHNSPHLEACAKREHQI